MSTNTMQEKIAENKKLREQIVKEISVIKQTGKLKYGIKNAIRHICKIYKEEEEEEKRAKVIIVAQNIPKEEGAKLRYLCALGNIPIVEFPGDAKELGEVCGRPHIVSVIVVLAVGSSSIMNLGKIPGL
ncbi:MAG: ribosomal L7Ae/L30e/S12e/Gadd45 family protein [Candidatus Njordarchaeia archaeon]|nr:ribosomal L7Ae/L30e/S12e/Gadd45 family protein [Candidatus Korarchaeota archaeon]